MIGDYIEKHTWKAFYESAVPREIREVEAIQNDLEAAIAAVAQLKEKRYKALRRTLDRVRQQKKRAREKDAKSNPV